MAKTVDEKCRAINVNLLENGDYATKEEIKTEIEKKAGSDERTLGKYWKKLTEKNIIKPQIKTNNFKIKELDLKIKPEGETKWIKFKIPVEIKEAIRTFGLNPTDLVTSTTLKKLDNYKTYTNKILRSNYDESEIKYMWALINHNLDEADDDKNNFRLTLFKETGNTIDSEKDMEKALVELRKKALDLEYKISGKEIPSDKK